MLREFFFILIFCCIWQFFGRLPLGIDEIKCGTFIVHWDTEREERGYLAFSDV